MRRGHSGIGGWRNENSRHFRPRGVGPLNFRPNRNYPTQDTLRFPPPGTRPPRGPPPYLNRTVFLRSPPPEHHESNKHRHESRQSNQYRPHERSHHQTHRSMFPPMDQLRHNETLDHGSHYKDNKKYYDKSRNEQCRINSMGDIDDRQPLSIQGSSEPYSRHPMSGWPHLPENRRPYYDERHNQGKSYRNDNMESNKLPILEYSGHRPPSSDHYGSSSGPTIENTNSFSRSVDDTVDIIRKRLQNRNDPQQSSGDSQPEDHHDIDDRITKPTTSNHPKVQHTNTGKRRIQRQRQNESNCDKMKSKIVHELFKMDKDKIHKLMDNPSSSSKFEYALSSLITESQNSLNRHLRSVAEKSLCSSVDFVHNDNNTIYEDTFMKQMQGILDPQDTVLLEDIKPLVLAELSKVLQLDEYDQPFQIQEEQGTYHPAVEQQNYDNYGYDFPDYCHDEQYEQIDPSHVYQDFNLSEIDNSQNRSQEFCQPEPEKPQPLFERRYTKISEGEKEVGSQERAFISDIHQNQQNEFSRVSIDSMASRDDYSFSSERRHSRRSLDKHSEETSAANEQSLPLFDTNVEQLSEEDDPFAELDQQYHVAVDHNFIDTYGISSPQQSGQSTPRSSSAKKELNIKPQTPIKDAGSIKKEIDSQVLGIAQSPLKLLSNALNKALDKKMSKASNIKIKQEVATTNVSTSSEPNIFHNMDMKIDNNMESRDVEIPTEPSENVDTSKSIVQSTTRKRSIDQRPSHRKEKRKKSDSTQLDSSKQILNKNIIINVSDCTSDPENCNEAAKSIFNLFFSKNEASKEVPKDNKKVEDKNYSDKYVKRKEIQRKSNEKEGEIRKRQRSESTSNSIVSPKEKDNLNNNSQSNKTDSKTKLQSIDMFSEQPKKASAHHQAHRNTALSPTTPVKTIGVGKVKPPVIAFNKKVTRRHISTQVSRKMHSKETQTVESKSSSTKICQTDRKKTVAKSIQTDPVTFERPRSKATDAFERMKEIDMEIQILLQEKFKLYNSLEANDPCPSTIQTLGMTVLNVAPYDEAKENEKSDDDNVFSGDSIVEDFTNIPVEELEQIALESVQEHGEEKKQEKKTRRQKVLEVERGSSSSPTTRRSKKTALSTPNISLLEQIIADDRPLEEIISLDELETTPVKSRKPRPQKTQPKKKAVKKSKMVKPLISSIEYDIKECSVVLTRIDISNYLKKESEDVSVITEPQPASFEVVVEDNLQIHEEAIELVEETVVNDLQFDMLDVSEDIVVGDNCEIKSSEDKDAERTEVTITEEIILDNSQSSEPLHSEVNQTDNICKTYDYSTDENLRRDSVVVSGHADAVLAIEFIENNFIAACLDGNVYYFSGDGQLISTLRGSNLAVTCLTIVKEKYGTTVYTGSLDSRIRYYDLDTGLEKGPECNVLSPIQTMDRAWDTIFVGTRTGFVLQFECKNNMLIPVSTVKFSEQSILALRAMKEGPRKVLLVAARSEDVTIKDAQTGLLLRTLQGPKMTVYTLLYEDGKIYCGTSSHQIHVFDYASGSHVGTHEGGKGAVCLRASGGLLFAGCYDGCVYVYREGEGRPLAQLRGPGLMLLSLALSGTKIIAGYKDRSLYIWKIPLSILQEMIL